MYSKDDHIKNMSDRIGNYSHEDSSPIARRTVKNNSAGNMDILDIKILYGLFSKNPQQMIEKH